MSAMTVPRANASALRSARVLRPSSRRAPLAIARAEAPAPATLAMPAASSATHRKIDLEPGRVLAVGADDLAGPLHQEAGPDRLVVVDVYTQWCGPCKMIAPELENMASEFGDKVVMTKIDCTSSADNKKWAISHNVKALPTFILFKNGVRINDMTGAKAANLKRLIEAHM